MTTTEIVVATVGAYALVLGLIGLAVERHRARRVHHEMRRLPVFVGVVGSLLGIAMLVLIAVSASTR